MLVNAEKQQEHVIERYIKYCKDQHKEILKEWRKQVMALPKQQKHGLDWRISMFLKRD